MSPLAAEDIQQLVPAFMGAAAVILVVAIGVLIFVWRQYPSPESAAGVSAIEDPERVAVKRGLKISGLVFAALGLAGLAAAIGLRAATIFGPASLLVPNSVITDGLMLAIAARRFSTVSNR